MLSASSQFLAAIKQDGRNFTYALYVNGGNTDYSENVTSISISADACNGSALSVGNFNKTQCKIVLYWDPDVNWAGSFIEPKMMVDGASDVIPLGKFWVYEDRQVGTNKTELTCYDVPTAMNDLFSVASTSVSTIISSIESLTGMYFVSKAPITMTTITAVPDGATNASVLALIAGYDELSVRATRTGGLEFFRFITVEEPITDANDDPLITETNAQITATWNSADLLDATEYYVERDQIYENGYSADKELFTIGAIVVDYNGKTYSRGTGYSYTVDSPYFTDAKAESLGYYLGATYRPMTFTFRGNPLLQAGDIIPVERADGTKDSCYVMGLDFIIDGGFKTQVRCYADKTAVRTGTTSSPIMKKVEEAMTILAEKFTEQTQLLAGGFGGFAKWHYLADGTPSELLFMDQPDESSAVHILMINKNGIGFSSDGGRTYRMAWTIDGHFNADFITAGVLTATLIKAGILSDVTGMNSWNLDTGELVTKLLRITELMQIDAGPGSYIRIPLNSENSAEGVDPCFEIRPDAPQFSMVFPTEWGGAYYITIDPENGLMVSDGDFTAKVAPNKISVIANLLNTTAELSDSGLFVRNGQTGKWSSVSPDNIATNGTKNRVAKGKLFYCYETPAPYFGDIGEAKVGLNEEVIVPIDPTFRECIQKPYQVFLQPYGRGEIWVHERADDHFTVRGSAGTAFGWEIKAKQYDYQGGSDGTN